MSVASQGMDAHPLRSVQLSIPGQLHTSAHWHDGGACGGAGGKSSGSMTPGEGEGSGPGDGNGDGDVTSPDGCAPTPIPTMQNIIVCPEVRS